MSKIIKPIPRIFILAVMFSSAILSSARPQQKVERHISVDEYEDRVLASWLGQIIGNVYGLSYEFKFLEEPGPDEFPYGYGYTLDRLREFDGAFSDDDTDIEYMSLIQMEKYGPEPTYRQLAMAWKYHIRDRIWAANRVALTLMHHGYWPPATGDSTNNPRWFEIDPQLVNEIWAVTAPGMVDYAVGKTEWAARITNDSFGIEPAMFYAAMYAEAFFETDVSTLIDVGVSSLPPDGRFAGVVAEMREIYSQHPDDWQAARLILRDRYYTHQPYNQYGWQPIDATVNGAAAVLALLYGKGDIQNTLDYACAMGFDADNQAATLTGLLSLSQGTSAIPRELLFPLEDADWEKPFNDRYINVTRYDLPDASVFDQASRLAIQGELVILEKGGRKESSVDGKPTYVISSSTQFDAPFELAPSPIILVDEGEPIDIQLYGAGGGNEITWHWDGKLPDGMMFENGRVSGNPNETGSFLINVTIRNKTQEESIAVRFEVREPNLASSAARLLHNEQVAELELIRDGLRRHPPYFSATRDEPFTQWYGYEWTDPVNVSRIGYYTGFPREEWGWLKNVHVEYLDTHGAWTPVNATSVFPPIPEGNTKYLQPGFVGYDVQFEPVMTRGIRLVGTAGGHPVDQPPTYGSSVSELTVHSR